CVRRIDEALRRLGRGLGGAGDSVELEAVVLFGVSGGLDRRRHFTGHPAGVLLLGELDSTERGGGILELLLVVTEVAVELLLADASIGRGAGYLEVALSRRLEVGRHQAGERVVHALELFAHSIPGSVTERTEEGVELGVEFVERTLGSAGAISHELHSIGDAVDLVDAEVCPRSQRALSALRL